MDLAEKELITKAQNGDQFAKEQLIFSCDRAVLAVALRFAEDKNDAKDLYNEKFPV